MSGNELRVLGQDIKANGGRPHTKLAIFLPEADGKNYRALTDLGVQLLRTGDEPGARTALEASFKADP